MLLAIDIGNTNIVLGLYQGKKLITHWRLLTEAERTSDEYGVIIAHLVDYKGFHCNQISAIVVSCVVPPMLTMIQELNKELLKGIRKGDRVEVTLTQSRAVSIERKR